MSTLACLHGSVKGILLPRFFETSTKNIDSHKGGQFFGTLTSGMDGELRCTTTVVQILHQQVQKQVQINSLEPLFSQRPCHDHQIFPQGRAQIICLWEMSHPTNVRQLRQEGQQNGIRDCTFLNDFPEQINASIRRLPGCLGTCNGTIGTTNPSRTTLAQFGRQTSAAVQLTVGMTVNVILVLFVFLTRHGRLVLGTGQLGAKHVQNLFHHGWSIGFHGIAQGHCRIFSHAPNLVRQMLRPPGKQRGQFRPALFRIRLTKGSTRQTRLIPNRPRFIMKTHEKGLQQHGHKGSQIMRILRIRSQLLCQFRHRLTRRLTDNVVVGIAHFNVITTDGTCMFGNGLHTIARLKELEPRFVTVQFDALGQIKAIEAHAGQQYGIERLQQ
mmetsp:Transcript_1856/g.3315  ORF Transcript_1856/g.3315 Transcript_1856/m.3315 type:complete len:384 (-) Transcript_1856:2638-3789(-)